MTKEKVIEIFNKYTKEMLFDINESEIEFYEKSISSYLGDTDRLIKEFDLSEWSKYNFEPSVLFNGHFREDEVENVSQNCLDNSIGIENGYVVVKNEK